MSSAVMPEVTATMPYLPQPGTAFEVEELGEEDRAEVLAFLAERPIHTVIMAGWIRDNGMVSPLNRGTFYGYRTVQGRLEGVALIGHVTLMEVRSDRALKAFARRAQVYPETHLLMGEQERIRGFWKSYAEDGQPVLRALRETLFELQSPVEEISHVPGLRLAEMSDLHLVMPAQAQMAFEESGVDPREADPEGFRKRCARRIEQGRVWVLIEDGKLVFKADIVSETPDVFYLEGVHVTAEARGRGIGTHCMAQLCNRLLGQTRSICVLVNEQNQEAQSFYRKLGFEVRDTYDTIFLRKKKPATATEGRAMGHRADARRLRDEEKVAVLEFLARSPARNVILAGWIGELGPETEVNGGMFYGYWNSARALEGAAVIGRTKMFETSFSSIPSKVTDCKNLSYETCSSYWVQRPADRLPIWHGARNKRVVARLALTNHLVSTGKNIEQPAL